MGNFCHLYENWAFLPVVWGCTCRVDAFCADANPLRTERDSVPDTVGPYASLSASRGCKSPVLNCTWQAHPTSLAACFQN